MAPTASISASTWSNARWRRRSQKANLSEDWLTGDGIALTMIDTVPPAGHSPTQHALREDGGFELTVGHRRVRQRHRHGASPDRRSALATTVEPHQPAAVRHRHGGHDTGDLWQRRHLRRRPRTQAAAEAAGRQMKAFAGR